MYVRVQKVRQGQRVYEYVHIVEGFRGDDGKVRHRVVANLGRRDQLKDSGALDNLAPRSPGWTRHQVAIWSARCRWSPPCWDASMWRASSIGPARCAAEPISPMAR